MKASFYQSQIIGATNCTIEQSICIEEIMRSVCPTMGHLSKSQLKNLAIKSFAAYKVMS
jgi:hypothetical protein